jgi:hypothetical protein
VPDDLPVTRLLSLLGGRDLLALPDTMDDKTGGAFSADGRMLVFWGSDVRVWELASGGEMLRLSIAGGKPERVAFSPDGRLMAIGGRNGAVDLFSGRNGVLLRRLTPNDGGASSAAVAFSPDGKLLASSCLSSAVIWDVSKDYRRPVANRLTRAALSERWTTLADADARAAHTAIDSLVADPEQSVPMLRERLNAVVFPSADLFNRLIANLGDAKYDKRDRATRELIRLGRWAEFALRSSTNLGTEASRRRDTILKALDEPSRAGEVLRVHRTVWALELIDTPESRAVLRWLVGRAEGTPPSREAAEALRRLELRR